MNGFGGLFGIDCVEGLVNKVFWVIKEKEKSQSGAFMAWSEFFITIITKSLSFVFLKL